MVISDAVQTLDRELRAVFGSRLQSLAIYGQRAHAQAHGDPHGAHASHHHQGPPTHTLAIVESLTADDLRGCAGRIEAWHDAGLATPLLFAAHEFEQSLDAFPLEFGAILADHTVVSGSDPFASLAVDPADVRRACEVQARSHLLHLREGFLETRGRSDALAVLIVRSAGAFAGLVSSIARLDSHATHDAASAARHVERLIDLPGGAVSQMIPLVAVHDISSTQAEQLFAPYLEAVTKIVQYVDGWSAR